MPDIQVRSCTGPDSKVLGTEFQIRGGILLTLFRLGEVDGVVVAGPAAPEHRPTGC